MKRLLQISFDTLIASLMSILIWFILSLKIDRTLINIFTLTFPIQYVSSIIISIFATGANISSQKGNKDDVMSGIFFGCLISIVLVVILLFNVDNYLNFMNYNVNHLFVIYSIIQIFLHTILSIILTKLYYEENNNLANKYSLIFYIINLVLICFTSVLFRNTIYVIVVTLIPLVIFVLYVLIKNVERFSLNFNILRWIRYDSVTLTDNILLGLAYVFGLSSTVTYGQEYITALTFIALITDTQWDISNSISTVAKIDISKNEFNYKEHVKNATKLTYLLIASVLIMYIIMFKFYDLNLYITFIYLGFHIIDFIICPYYKIDAYYLQLEYSTSITTVVNLSSRIFRFILSFIRTPFCTVIAQLLSSIYQVITMKFLFNKNFKVSKNGKIMKLQKIESNY